TKRMSNRWQMMMSYVFSRLDGDRVSLVDSSGTRTALDYTDPNNLVPSMRNARGINDQPHAFKLIGSFQAPLGINLGVNYEAVSGLPRERLLSVALTQGTLSMAVDERGTYRADFLNLLSLRGDKSIGLGGPRKITLIAEVHNALNSHAGQN